MRPTTHPHRVLLTLAATLLLAATPVAAPAAPPPPTWEVAPLNPTGFELLHDRALALKLNLVCWGPSYKWFGYPGPARADATGTRILQQTAPINGTPARLSLDFRAAQPSPTSVTLAYSLAASDPVDFTGVAQSLNPSPGTTITATFDDGTQAPIDWHKPGDIAKPVRRLAISFAGDTYTLDLSTPRHAETYWNELRLWLATAHAPTQAAPADTTLTLNFPAPARFYPRETDAAQSDITPDWFPYPVATAGTPVDLSFLNKDAAGHFIPAGAHGFLQVKGDSFVFADGTPARFWGVNVTAYAALGSYPRSAQLADRLARLGCNVVRLHHLDSWGPNIIDTNAPDDTTQHLDPNNLARLDRLIFELKSHGIYVILDPWVGRAFRPGDDVPGSDQFQKGNFGLHPYIFFDPHMRALHKKFLHDFWTHTNQFTHLAYKDDPAIATTECANEALFSLPKDMPDPYRTELIQLYTRWCAANHLDPGQPDDIIKLNWPTQHQRFYQSLMQDFFADIRSYLKHDLGLKIPINDSNWFHWPWEIGAQTAGDFMDSHHYYHGNRIGPSSEMGGLWLSNAPSDNSDTPFATMSAMAILGKPLTVSECGDNPPQTYRSAYYLGLAAVASLQGYDSITPFAYSQAAAPVGKLSNFEMESDPATVASLAAGALLYRRGDVQPAKHLAVMLLPTDEQYAMHWQDDYKMAFDHTPQFRAMVETHQVAVVYGDKLPPGTPTPAVTMTPSTASTYKPQGTQLLSDTHELWRDFSRGVGLINTPRTQAAYGLLSSTPISTSDVTFNISTPFATCSLSSLTNAPIKSSTHLLLTTVARAEDANQTYNLSRTQLVTSGHPPVLAEPVTGSLTFSTTATSLTAHPLLPTGAPGPAIPLTIQDGKATLQLNASSKTLFYDITATP